jgi:hypothetical protein
MIIGERGIGKTSLLLYVKHVACGLIPLDEKSFNYAIIDLDIDANTTQVGIIKRIQIHLEEQLAKTEPARHFLKETWSFIQRIHFQGSNILGKKDEEDLEVLIDQFALSMASVVNRVCSEDAANLFSSRYDGILLLLDEVDNCSEELRIGSFLKLLLERLQRCECNRVLIGLAGLPELRHKLYSSHPSSLRIFEEVQLGRLSNQEVERVIDIGLNRAKADNNVKTVITDDAKKMLVNVSEGYPHFIQQFGASAFAYDKDDIIDQSDVVKSSFGSRGALDLIGDRYYRNDFYNKIQQEEYRQILRIMADDLDEWVKRSKIRDRFKGADSTLNNALRSLRDKHIILAKEGEKGVYRLQHRGFALWIKLHADPDFKNWILKKNEKEKLNLS